MSSITKWLIKHKRKIIDLFWKEENFHKNEEERYWKNERRDRGEREKKIFDEKEEILMRERERAWKKERQRYWKNEGREKKEKKLLPDTGSLLHHQFVHF